MRSLNRKKREPRQKEAAHGLKPPGRWGHKATLKFYERHGGSTDAMAETLGQHLKTLGDAYAFAAKISDYVRKKQGWRGGMDYAGMKKKERHDMAKYLADKNTEDGLNTAKWNIIGMIKKAKEGNGDAAKVENLKAKLEVHELAILMKNYPTVAGNSIKEKAQQAFVEMTG